MDNTDLETQLAVLQVYRDIKVEKLYEELEELEKLFMEYNINIIDFNNIRLNLIKKYG
jgi:hypothetical protein